MSAAASAPASPAPLDPVAELKLRRWARLNHVAAADRDPRWHPVVWAEMAARDRELAALPVDANRPRLRVDPATAGGPAIGRLAGRRPRAAFVGPAVRRAA